MNYEEQKDSFSAEYYTTGNKFEDIVDYYNSSLISHGWNISRVSYSSEGSFVNIPNLVTSNELNHIDIEYLKIEDNKEKDLELEVESIEIIYDNKNYTYTFIDINEDIYPLVQENTENSSSLEDIEEVQVGGKLKEYDDAFRPLLKEVFGNCVYLTQAYQVSENIYSLTYTLGNNVLVTENNANALAERFKKEGYMLKVSEVDGNQYLYIFGIQSTVINIVMESGSNKIEIDITKNK